MKKILYSILVYFDNHSIRVEWESKERLIEEITDSTSIATLLEKMPGIKKEVAQLLYIYGDEKQVLKKIYLKIKNLLIHLVTKINVIYENQERLYDPILNTTTLYDLLVMTKKELKQAEGLLLVNDDDILLVRAKEDNDDILSQLVRVDYKKEAKEFIESLDKYYDVSNTVKFPKKKLGAIALSLYICRYFNHNHSFTEFQKLVCQYFDKEEISYKPNKVFDEFNKIMNDFPYNDFKADKEQYKRFFP